MLPIYDDRMLPDANASLSQNAWLYSGALIGMRTPTALHTCVLGSTAKVFRIPNNFFDSVHLADSIWLEFTDINTDVVRSPVVGDTFDRYYFTSPSVQPLYNTAARIGATSGGVQTVGAANGPFILGIPAPTNAPGVTPAGGVSSINVTRSYVQTWVSAYGEEGPPSPPTTVTGKTDDTWAITLQAAAGGDLGTNRNLTRTRIYRTVTSSTGVATFFLVVDQAIATLTYNDTNSDTVVSANAQLLSTTWIAPPNDLAGWVSMPNGMIAGWRVSAPKEIWFCEPFRPHAWPAQYAVAVDYPIVGMGVVGQMLVVCTEGYPYALSGVNPASVTQLRLGSLEPCMSRGSVVSTQEGVYYASANGLCLVAQGAVLNLSKQILTKDRWLGLVLGLGTLHAAMISGAYYAWGTVRQGVFQPTAFEPTAFQQFDNTGAINGILLDVNNMNEGFNLLFNAAQPMSNVFNDTWTSEILLIRNNIVYTIDFTAAQPAYDAYVWRSKDWQLKFRDNLAAARAWFDIPPGTPAQSGVRNNTLVQTLAAGQYLLLRVYADDVLVLTWEVRTSGEIIRLPSGFKPEYYQFELNGVVKVKGLEFASSVKELRQV
jgi:hypothetical protein